MSRSIHIGRSRPSHAMPASAVQTVDAGFADVCRQVIQQAYDTGAEVNVYLRSVWDTHFVGQVLAVGPEHFELFHSGQVMGYRWTLPITDVAACALVTRLTAGGDGEAVGRSQNEPPSEAVS